MLLNIKMTVGMVLKKIKSIKKAAIMSAAMAAVMVFAVTITMILTAIVNAKAVYASEAHYLHDVYISVNGGEAKYVRAVDCEYDNNLYISLRDIAEALRGTNAAFNIEVTNDEIAVSTGDPQSERSLDGWQDEEKDAFTAKEVAMNSFTFNGSLRKYYNLRAAYGDGVDCFLRPVNLCMMLDIDIDDAGEDSYSINTNSILAVSPEELEEDGYFDEVGAALIGDATTGRIYYEYNADAPLPIASTTKLMTYLLTEEAIERGELTEEDYVTVSEAAASLSASADGTVAMSAGSQATVRELILGALLPSSNECALLLGEKVGGSSDAFTQLMNEKAAQLGMTTAHFNNPNGLPDYNDSGLPSKRQNQMSAEDMFRMCSYILNNFPQIKEVTSLTDASLTSFGRDIKNTNALLYNMPEINGLKTGTTDRAGACLVTSLTVNDGSMDHDLVVVLLGAENNNARFTTSQLLAYYGKNVVLGQLSADGHALSAGSSEETAPVTITSSSLVNMVVSAAMQKNNAGS